MNLKAILAFIKNSEPQWPLKIWVAYMRLICL
jgi:hypothetical protein